MVLLAAPAWFSPAWWRWLLASPCLAAAALLLLSAIAPARFLAGVRRVPDGFEVRVPLRRPQTLLFGDIRRIVAVSLKDRDTGEPVLNFLVSTRSASARLDEHALFHQGLLSDLQKLPGFDAAEYDRALQCEPPHGAVLSGKRFTVLAVT